MNNIKDNRGDNYLNRQNSIDRTNKNSRKEILVNLTNTKSYMKRYTDVHANSKILYNQDVDSNEKNFVEQSQWNDRTNRYFYLKEKNNSTNINKNANNTVDSYYNHKFLENNNYGRNYNFKLNHRNSILNNMQNNIDNNLNYYKVDINNGINTNQNNIKYLK